MERKDKIPFLEPKGGRAGKSRLVLEPGTNLDTNLLCGLCKEIAFQAEECGNCETVFCRACLADWKEQNNSCPKGCIELNIRQAHKLIRNALSSLKYQCTFSQNGCQAVTAAEHLSQHESSCDYQFVRCRYPGCGTNVVSKTRAEHEQVCEYRETFCEKCELSLLMRDFKSHNCVKALTNFYRKLKQDHKNFLNNAELIFCQLTTQATELEKAACTLATGKPFPLNTCKKGHSLQWNETGRTNYCPLCEKNKNFSRLLCLACKEKFCTDCRFPKLNSEACPIGHAFIKVNTSSGRSCDICRKDIEGPESWLDKNCDFDICVNCKEDLDQGINLVNKTH